MWKKYTLEGSLVPYREQELREGPANERRGTKDHGAISRVIKFFWARGRHQVNSGVE